MAVEATGSRYTCKTNYLIAAACLVFGLWFFYDGWFNEEFQQEHTVIDEQTGAERPDATLQANRTWIPIGCGVVLIYFVVAAVRLKSKKVVAEEAGLIMNDGHKITYPQIRQIDKRRFDQKGYFIIEYEQSGGRRTMKFDDRTWDGLGLLLEEITKRTGAKPAVEVEQQETGAEEPSEENQHDQAKD